MYPSAKAADRSDPRLNQVHVVWAGSVGEG